MRSFVVMAMFLASFSDAAWNDYSTVRDLKVDADGIESVEINAGAGSLDSKGVAGLDKLVIIDGSGSIRVSDVEQDLTLVDDGSGGFSYSDIRGGVVDDS